MFQKNPQHPALLCEQDLKQDCVGAKRPPRNFKHPDLSPISVFWKDCSSAFHWCEEAVRVFWSNPSASDCWTAAAPRTPKEFLGVPGVQTCNRCGRGCWPWWGLVVRLEAVENLGAILLFRTAPIERLCAMPMRHWREASKRMSPKCKQIFLVSVVLWCSTQESCESNVRGQGCNIRSELPYYLDACDRPRFQSSLVRQHLYFVPPTQNLVPGWCPISVWRGAHNHAHQSTIFHVQFGKIIFVNGTVWCTKASNWGLYLFEVAESM